MCTPDELQRWRRGNHLICVSLVMVLNISGIDLPQLPTSSVTVLRRGKSARAFHNVQPGTGVSQLIILISSVMLCNEFHIRMGSRILES